MNCFQSLSILAICLGYVLTASDFDCNRSTNECVVGTCTENNGECTCPLDASNNPTHTNKDCSLVAASIASDANLCDPPCLNGGTCYESTTSVYNCSCPTDYFGMQCETKRMATTCTGDSMTVTITPFPQFSGTVFVSNKTEVTGCAFVKTGDEFAVTMAFSGDCGIETAADTPNPGDFTYTNLVIIRSSNFFESPFDISLTVKCTHTASGITNIGENIPQVSVVESANLTSEIAETTYKPVSFNIQTPTGGYLQPPVFIGDPLRIYIPLSDTGKYTKLIITALSVHNGLTGAGRIEVPLITDKCQTSDGKTVITGSVINDATVPALIINFRAFKVVGTDSLNFASTVKVCIASDPACDAATCTSGSGRRKRDVSPKPAENDFVLHDSIIVLNPLSGQQEPNVVIEPVTVETPAIPNSENVFSDPEKCLESKEILVMVIVLITAVVLLLVITTCLAVRFIKSRAQVKVMDHTNLMSSDMNMVKIPRPTF